jgi:hypothetical protein
MSIGLIAEHAWKSSGYKGGGGGYIVTSPPLGY